MLLLHPSEGESKPTVSSFRYEFATRLNTMEAESAISSLCSTVNRFPFIAETAPTATALITATIAVGLFVEGGLSFGDF